ncbi:MAG: hypothetical protein ABEJ61_05190 [Haloferacaceae archaeon]
MRLHRAVDVEVDRFESNPLVAPDADGGIGRNVNGPSVVRAPPWVDEPLGRYYMYFAHHGGDYVRLAYADDLRGPWQVHPPGTLHREETRFDGHVASPDVHVDREHRRVRMYFHGCCGPFDHPDGEFAQATDVATSVDGLDFEVRGETLGNSYFRVWERGDRYYALANDGHLYRGSDPFEPFERRQELFARNRHFAVRPVDDDRLQVFLTRRGDRPERLMTAVVDTAPPDEEWRADPHPPETVLWPDRAYEGGDRPLATSGRGRVDGPVRALRDPAVFEEGDRLYLFYAVAGERGIGGAELRRAAGE